MIRSGIELTSISVNMVGRDMRLNGNESALTPMYKNTLKDGERVKADI